MGIFSEKQSFQNEKQDLRDIESYMLHAVRFLRDKEKEVGIVSGKGQKIFDMLRRTFYQKQKRQK